MKEKRIKKIGIYLLIGFLFSSCENNRALIPLNSVSIPEYEDTDYIKLLDNDDPEIVYSAVCHFIYNARDYAKLLSTDTIKDSAALKNAELIYSKISHLLYSNNEWIVCSSLRFFSAFGETYTNKEEIADKLLDAKLRTTSIRLEYINALKGIYGANTSRFESILKDYLVNKSWIISRYSFSLLPYFNSDELNNKLITKYKKAKEYDKLLIISSLSKNYKDTILDFLLSTLNQEENPKIKLFIIKNLGKAQNNQKVIDWFVTSYPKIDLPKKTIEEYYLNYIHDSSHVEILCALLKQHLISDSLIISTKADFLNNVYAKLFEEGNVKSTVEPRNLLKLDSLLTIDKSYGDAWINLKDERSMPVYKQEFEQKQLRLIEEYESKVAKLYEEYKIDKKYKNNYINRIQDLKKEFRKEE
ncbi:MAG: hypothetical protein PHI54_07890 [Bacteroidales bacterium]|nr:hypothetical protein [Bacteroidales bacterium]